MFASLFSFSSRNLSYHKFSRFSLRSQLHRPGDTKCNVLDLAECQNQFNHRKFLWLIHLDRLINYSYSFGKQPAARIFKNKNCCFPSHQQVYLKRTWPIHQSLRSILWRVLQPQMCHLVLLKTEAEAAVRKYTSK